MWIENEQGHRTFIDVKNLKMFQNKGWKAWYPSQEKKEIKPKNNKKK